MTQTATTHCTTCQATARDTIIEGMAEVVMDDQDVDYDTAVRMLDAKAIDENVTEYLDGILAAERASLTTNPSACSTIHTDWY